MNYLNIYLLLALFFATPANIETKSKAPSSLNEFEKEVLVYVNEYRSKNNLPPLKMNDYVSGVSREHSKNMATKRARFGHGGFDKRYKLIKTKTAANSMSENVIYGYNTPESAVKGWIERK